MYFVGKSFKVESLTKTFASSIVVCEEEFQLCYNALLCQSMYKPWITGCWQEDTKYGHLSTWMWGSHGLHIRDGKRVGSNRCFQQLPIYLAFQKWSSYVICDVETNGWIKKWLDNNLSKVGLLSHLWMEVLWGGQISCMIWSMWARGKCLCIFQIGPGWNLWLCISSRKVWYMCMRLSTF
jgi:hypothetical protein